MRPIKLKGISSGITICYQKISWTYLQNFSLKIMQKILNFSFFSKSAPRMIWIWLENTSPHWVEPKKPGGGNGHSTWTFFHLGGTSGSVTLPNHNRYEQAIVLVKSYSLRETLRRKLRFYFNSIMQMSYCLLHQWIFISRTFTRLLWLS